MQDNIYPDTVARTCFFDPPARDGIDEAATATRRFSGVPRTRATTGTMRGVRAASIHPGIFSACSMRRAIQGSRWLTCHAKKDTADFVRRASFAETSVVLAPRLEDQV
jgi:hypothetical protein